MPHLLVGAVLYFLAAHLAKYIYNSLGRRKIVLAFFHPYCDSGGGGERVLWVLLKGLLTNTVESRTAKKDLCSVVDKYDVKIVIYSGEASKSKEDILENVQNKFGITFTAQQQKLIEIVKIRTRTLLEAKWYPVATMICQSLASILVGLECVLRKSPDIYVDTMGAAFTYPLVRCFFASKVVAYVHYPIISSDMLKRVRDQRPSYNNAGRVATSVTVSSLKLIYYRCFAAAYRVCGYFADVTMVNSSWTKNHIEELWQLSAADGDQAKDLPLWIPRRLSLVYPPCNTTTIQQKQEQKKQRPRRGSLRSSSPSVSSSASSSSPEKQKAGAVPGQALYEKYRVIVSVGQFRPEKDHMLQIRSMEEFVMRYKDSNQPMDDVVLVMMGSTRHADDLALANSLQRYIDERSLSHRIFILQNQPYSVIEDYLRHSVVGIHSMWNEHFGISVVEMLAGGLITIAHNSGGPKADIIQPGVNGYLATEPEEYADILVNIFQDSENNQVNQELRRCAKESAQQYSDEIFVAKATAEFDGVLGDTY